MAAGVPRNQVYPATDDKVKQAFDKLRELKSNVKVWWTAGRAAGPAAVVG